MHNHETTTLIALGLDTHFVEVIKSYADKKLLVFRELSSTAFIDKTPSKEAPPVIFTNSSNLDSARELPFPIAYIEQDRVSLFSNRGSNAFEGCFSEKIIDVILRLSKLPQEEGKAATKPLPPIFSKQAIVAQSEVMRKILSDVKKIAKSNANVFICGESGTGKEEIAHALHQLSLRNEKPFVRVNCAALPESLIESEFFGHEKGAFTGALNRRLGRFELADRGTLLLDEISEIRPHLQAKLLRVTQEQEFERVGGCTPVKIDVRFISTSNRDIEEMIKEEKFRSDLFYRLGVVVIHLPPLRDRKEDVLPLASHFLQKHAMSNKKPFRPLSKEAEEALLKHRFPGNIRQLSNMIERGVVLAEGDAIEVGDLIDLHATNRPSKITTPKLEDVEKLHILESLASHSNNRTKTAAALGISIRTLRNKLSAYRVDEKAR